MLGASVPACALAAALKRRTRHATAVLWSQTPTTARGFAIRAALAGGARVVAAGPWWTADTIPDNIFRVDSLAEALRLLLWRRGQLHRSLARGTLVLCRVLRLIWKVGQYVGDGIERRGIGEVVAY